MSRFALNWVQLYALCLLHIHIQISMYTWKSTKTNTVVQFTSDWDFPIIFWCVLRYFMRLNVIQFLHENLITKRFKSWETFGFGWMKSNFSVFRCLLLSAGNICITDTHFHSRSKVCMDDVTRSCNAHLCRVVHKILCWRIVVCMQLLYFRTMMWRQFLFRKDSWM